MNKSKKIAILFLKIPGQLELGSKLGLRKYFISRFVYFRSDSNSSTIRGLN